MAESTPAGADASGSSRPTEPALLELAAVMRRLRAECPWKAAQTHASLARYLLEEAHETLEAIDTGDLPLLREELGDLLLQVYFHGAIAEEAGEFTLDDVARGITDKLYRRNPHVFGPDADPRSSAALDPAEVNEAWEAAKAAEKQRTSVLEGLPPGLPALLLADKVLDRIDRLDRVAPTASVPASEVADPQARVGERLLAMVEESRRDGVDPEQALRDAVRRRVAAVEG